MTRPRPRPPGTFAPRPLVAALASGDEDMFAAVEAALAEEGGHLARAARRLGVVALTLRRAVAAHPRLRRARGRSLGRSGPLEEVLAGLPPGPHVISLEVPEGDPGSAARAVLEYCEGVQLEGQP